MRYEPTAGKKPGLSKLASAMHRNAVKVGAAVGPYGANVVASTGGKAPAKSGQKLAKNPDAGLITPKPMAAPASGAGTGSTPLPAAATAGLPRTPVAYGAGPNTSGAGVPGGTPTASAFPKRRRRKRRGPVSYSY